MENIFLNMNIDDNNENIINPSFSLDDFGASEINNEQKYFVSINNIITNKIANGNGLTTLTNTKLHYLLRYTQRFYDTNLNIYYFKQPETGVTINYEPFFVDNFSIKDSVALNHLNDSYRVSMRNNHMDQRLSNVTTIEEYINAIVRNSYTDSNFELNDKTYYRTYVFYRFLRRSESLLKTQIRNYLNGKKHKLNYNIIQILDSINIESVNITYSRA